MKKRFFALLCTVILCAMYICGGMLPASAEESNPSDGAPLSIYCLFPWGETSYEAQIMAAIAEAYKRDHPDFEYRPEYIPGDEPYYQKLKILISSNEMPDWFFGDPDTFTKELREEGLIYNVGALLEEMDLLDYFYDITLAYPSFDDGSRYLLGLGATTEYFYYHPSLFEQAGVSVPKTFDEFFAACEQLKSAGITPLSLFNAPWYILRFAAMVPFRMTGNTFINEARIGEAKFNSEVGLAAGEFVQKIANYAQNGWAGADPTASVELFQSGSAAMMYIPGNNFCIDSEWNMEEDVAYFPMPTLDGYNATKPTDFFANSGKAIVIRDAAVTEQMKDYIKFFVEHFGDIAYEHGFISGIKPSDLDSLPVFYQAMLENFGNVASDSFTHVWDVRLDSITNEVMKAEVINMAIGEITPEEWAKRVDAAVAENAAAAFGGQ